MGERTVATPANTLANRISHVLGINGPSIYLDTACSSSLSAFHLALNAINGGECEAALVGGCQLNTKSVFLVDEGQFTLIVSFKSVRLGLLFRRGDYRLGWRMQAFRCPRGWVSWSYPAVPLLTVYFGQHRQRRRYRRGCVETTSQGHCR